jgi:tetratricopeptide (TPR) repeat protein
MTRFVRFFAQDQFDDHGCSCADELLADLNEFVFERGPDNPLLAAIFSLFEEISNKLQESDNAVSLPREYNSEFLSIIWSYGRRIHVAFMSMSFEQVCELATEFEMYTNGALPVIRDSLTIEENIEKAMVELHAGVRDKERLLEELGRLCDQLREVSFNPISRSLLQAEALLAEEKRDEAVTVEKTYEFSDIPESRLDTRVGVERQCAPGTDLSMETITDAALNVALCEIRLGQLRDAMQLVNEHMRVSQQTSNARALVFSLGALCQILARAVPGALEVQSVRKRGNGCSEKHYVELAELLRRLDGQSQEENIPEMTLFARLLSTELEVVVGGVGDEPGDGYGRSGNSIGEKCDEEANEAGIAARDAGSPCHAASTTLETVMYTKQLACELSTLAAGGPSKLPSSLFAPPKPAGHHSFDQSDSRTALYAKQCTQTANQIRAAGWQVWGSSRLSLEMALGVLHSSDKNREAEISSLSLVLVNLYDQFGFAPIDQLCTNSKLMSLVKTNVELQRSWDMIHQKMAAHAGEWRDALDLATRIHVHPKTDDVAHLRHTVETHELAALAYLAGGKYGDADRLAKEGLTLAKKSCVSTYSLQLLLLRGRIHLEAGSWETACPFFSTVLREYERHHADIIGAEAHMYMSQVHMHRGDLEAAERELSSCLPTLLAHGTLETKSVARIAQATLLVKQASTGDCKTNTDAAHSMDAATARDILPLLCDAERDITKIRAKKLKSDVLYLAGIAYDKLGDTRRRDACAEAFIALEKEAGRDQRRPALDQRLVTTQN